jgi:DNA-directed RNA polymerase specialized sigma24 family protein
MDGLEFEEMAARLGKSLDAVRKLRRRAIQQLQEELRASE